MPTKDNKKENVDELTADELLEKIEADKKQLKKSSVFAFVALIAIIALGIAWFVSNTRVRSTASTISADARSVELKTYGGAGIHDDLLKKMMKQENPQDENWYTKVLQAAGLETSAEKYSVNWLLSDQSNIGNYSTKQSDWEQYWSNPPQGAERQDEAIEPGSSGRLTFYVVPKYDGKVELNMNLNLIPYKVNGDTFTVITGEHDGIAKNFVDGHILFFLEKETDTSKKGIQWIKDGTFDIQIENAEKDKAYEYTLYWCWPQSFGEAVLKAGDGYLNQRPILFSDFENGETMRNTILQIDALSMVNAPGRYFYSNLTKNPLTATQSELQQIADMYNKPSAEFSEKAKNAFVDLSSYYNQADRYIGGHVDCVRVRLICENK